MYTKQESAKNRQAFWTTFGQYMQPVLSAEGMPVNWINYRTGVPHIQFKMEAGEQKSRIAILLTHPDTAMRRAQYEQMAALKGMFEKTLQEEWNWEETAQDEHGKAQSRVYTELAGVNINRTDDWPKIISFLKPRMVALDAFWSMTRYSFDGTI